MLQREIKLHLVHLGQPNDRRLGRHVNHDAESKRFLARMADPHTLTSRRHTVNTPITDQQQGSCTGHAETAVLATAPFWPASRQFLAGKTALEVATYAVGLYSAATALDPWPGTYLPTDTGSDGLSVAKAAVDRFLISGYRHATSLAAALTALAEQAVMVGIGWRSAMFEPDSEGRIRIDGVVEGGHEICLDEIDVQRERAWMRNSWGEGWGQGGRGFVTWDDLGTLLADDGDCTVLVPRSEPAPTPGPLPAPTPAPAAPEPSPMGPEEFEFARAMVRFLGTTTPPTYIRATGGAWLATRRPPA